MNKAEVTLLILLLLSMVFVEALEPVNAQSPGVIRIKADGSVTGTNKILRNESVYTVVGDLFASVAQGDAFIFVERSDIVLDGADFSVQGSGFGSAIHLLRSQNVTVKNFVIRGFSRGIDFGVVDNWPADLNVLSQQLAVNNQIYSNVIEVSSVAGSNQTRDAGWCVYLNTANQTRIYDNSFISHSIGGGVYLSNSTYATSLIDNSFVGGGIYCLKSEQNIVRGNTIDGKQLVYFDGESNRVVDGAGLVYLFNCSNITVKNINPEYVYAVTIQLVDTVKCEVIDSVGHVLLADSNYNSIHDNVLRSVVCDASSYNQVFNNRISDFSVCIKLYGESRFNRVYNNLLLDTIYSVEAAAVRKDGFHTVAIQLGDSQLGGAFNNEIKSNMMVNHDCVVELFLSDNNTIIANVFKDGNTGIQFGKSHNNTVMENNVTSCKYAVSIYAGSSDNTFYHNNFMDNQIQVIETYTATLLSESGVYATGNTLDNGVTGNYWDTYRGVDENGDDIGDTPYRVFEDMTDYYPLMKPFETANVAGILIPPTHNPTERPEQNGPEQPPLSKEDKIIIVVTVGIVVGVVGGLLIYFRRLIFRKS
ncbi:MAG: right-handed parallel beta-helix repeat-containing protein [Nitrososphaerota archaeon]|jgi:parallel beta-helix repeat protein|nr:right-handed parallel beta-helix repeat-containing protein [Nitrososphaerota archaeon]